jgi:superfamily II DNA or RNA helicase
MPELPPFQKEGVAFALDREASVIADSMGLGKTAQAVGVINGDASIRRVLVVCPASVRIPWQRELDQWLNRSFTIAVVGVNCQKPLSGNGITIINYDRFARFENELGAYDLAVLDECHYIKSPDSKRTRAALSLKAKRKLALSGTLLHQLSNRAVSRVALARSSKMARSREIADGVVEAKLYSNWAESSCRPTRIRKLPLLRNGTDVCCPRSDQASG